MKSGTSKSYHQSYICDISRVSKLVVNRIHLGSIWVILEVGGRHGPTVPAVNIITFVPICRDTVGSPYQRSISNLCLSVMKKTFNVKSASSIFSLSAALTLFQVSDKWLVVGTINSIIVCEDNNSQLRSYELCIYMLSHIYSQH